MHLLTFMEMRRPGPLFRAAVIVAQGVSFNLMFVSYLVSPRFCHACVGYLEEEAVKTYTHALNCIDAGDPGTLWWNQPSGDGRGRSVISIIRRPTTTASFIQRKNRMLGER